MNKPKTHNWGQILSVFLPTRTPHGHEQEGMRPCLLLADPAFIQPMRYPLLIVAPLSTKSLAPGPLYPRLAACIGGLPETSTVLLDQLTAIDTSRVRGYIGALTEKEFAPIRKRILLLFS